MKINAKKIINKIIDRTKVILLRALFLFCLTVGIYSFTYELPYYISIGIMLLSISFISFPKINSILKRFNLKINALNRVYIILISFLSVAFTSKPDSRNYIDCLINFMIILLGWISLIFYLKRKQKN